MHLTKGDIFWKSWWWSVVCGATVGILFYAATSTLNFSYGGASFVDILITLSVAGSYFGAGYVGSRIADKYYYSGKRFAKSYRNYSLLTFVMMVGLAFSPLSFLGVFWSLVPPLGVVRALDRLKQKDPLTSKRRKTA